MESLTDYIKEIQVPVPWGHVAVKAWGDEKDEFVLVFHGLLDNAGSFDRLLPHLPKSFYYLCIDLPGHGQSSHFPSHVPIYTLNYIIVYKLIMMYFKQNSYVVIGHSYGGQIGFLFAQLYPYYVKKLVLLDTISLFPVLVTQFKEFVADKFDRHLEIIEKLATREEPTYTYNDALEKILTGRNHGSLTTEAAAALLPRMIKPTNDGRYKFTIDQRLKNFFNPLRDFRLIIDTMKTYPVNCPILIILGKDSKAQQHFMRPITALLKSWKNVTIKQVDGNHDVHINNPKIVAPLINYFILQQKGKL